MNETCRLLRQGSLEERVRSSEDALEELRANHSRLGTDYEKALEHGRTLEGHSRRGCVAVRML